MYLGNGLLALVKDWQAKLASGEETMSLATVVGKLGGEQADLIDSRWKPLQVVDLIESELRQAGELANVEKYLARFKTPEELLAATDLNGVMCGVGVPDDDGL